MRGVSKQLQNLESTACVYCSQRGLEFLMAVAKVHFCDGCRLILTKRRECSSCSPVGLESATAQNPLRTFESLIVYCAINGSSLNLRDPITPSGPTEDSTASRTSKRRKASCGTFTTNVSFSSHTGWKPPGFSATGVHSVFESAFTPIILNITYGYTWRRLGILLLGSWLPLITYSECECILASALHCLCFRIFCRNTHMNFQRVAPFLLERTIGIEVAFCYN